MQSKVNIKVIPCKKEEYSIKITFKDKEEMLEFLKKKYQEKKELAELRLQNEHLKKENASYEVQIQAWSEEYGEDVFNWWLYGSSTENEIEGQQNFLEEI